MKNKTYTPAIIMYKNIEMHKALEIIAELANINAEYRKRLDYLEGVK